jgi:hypothetical protein
VRTAKREKVVVIEAWFNLHGGQSEGTSFPDKEVNIKKLGSL